VATQRLGVIFSNDWWQKPMDEVIATCIARHTTVV
jgi:hypothetical protein